MARNTRDSGKFLVLEGPDGCGKSTQAVSLVETLVLEGRETLHLRDPGGTRIGEKVREILLDPAHEEMCPRAETLLFMASRAQLVAERIRPALESGVLVVCERWIPSTVCYQGYAGGLDPEEIWRMGEAAAGGVSPDLTLVLDVAAAAGLGRIEGDPDLMERRSLDYHRKVREGYLTLAREGRMNSVLIAAGGVDEVRDAIREEVANVLELPMSFDSIPGQESAVSLLRRIVRAGRAGSAYLLFGPEGVGKRSAALAFARGLLCPDSSDTGDACDACPSCLRSAAGSHPGLFVIERLRKKTLISIKQVHELGAHLSLRPVEGESRVAVIDRAERSTLEALNALLKTLEEPPPGATLVLVSASRESLPETIVSRCQGIRFGPLPAPALARILTAEAGLDEETARRVAELAGGSTKRAERILAMQLHEGERALDRLMSGEEDPVAAGDALAALALGGDRAEVRLRAREILLLLMETVRNRWLAPTGAARDPERAGFCLRALVRALDNLDRNVDAPNVLKSMLIEILPRWSEKTPT